MIYFDNAATTYPKPECVYEALDKANRNAFNAGRGEYDASTEAFNLIEDTRNKLGSLVGVSGSKVIFTSSATESLNMIINGISIQDGDNVYVSPFEHNAVIRPLKLLQKKVNFSITVIPFNKETWLPDLEWIENEFSINRPKAVFISHISNVTGYLIPYKEIFAASSKWGGINVLDCAQSFGVINPEIDNVDYLVFAGHKSLYASFGIAGFMKLGTDELEVSKAGGTGSDSLSSEMPGQIPHRYEAGSPNIVAIAGLNASVDWLNKFDVYADENELYSQLIKRLEQIPRVILFLPKNSKTFGVVSFDMEGYKSDDIASILNEEYQISVRSGYHCAPLVHDFIGSYEFGGTVRISLGAFNTISEVNALCEALESF